MRYNYELIKCTCKTGCKLCNYKMYVKLVKLETIIRVGK